MIGKCQAAMSQTDYDPYKDEDGPTYCTKCGWDDCTGNCR